jgi:hypothetical protein
MAKPWAIVGGTGFDLEDVDNPRTREMECPSCKRWVRFVEKDLVKNLKVFGLSLIGVEEPKRVFACPSCNTAIEPPEDAGLSRADPKVASLERKAQQLKEDIDLWTRRADLAERRGDDVLAREARGVATSGRAELEKVERALAKLTAWDEESDDKPVVVARLKSPASGAAEGEGPSFDKAFSALKSKIATVTSAVGGGGDSGGDDAPKASSPFVKGAEAEEVRRKEAAIERAAEDEFAALKARLKTGGAKAGAPAAEPTNSSGPEPAALGDVAAPAADEGPASDQSRGGEDFSRSAMSAAELGLGVGLDYEPKPRSSASPAQPLTPGEGEPPKGAPAAPPPEDDDPVAALKRKLKKPTP